MSQEIIRSAPLTRAPFTHSTATSEDRLAFPYKVIADQIGVRQDFSCIIEARETARSLGKVTKTILVCRWPGVVYSPGEVMGEYEPGE